ncbi:MAG: KH domain-containing protein [Bacilli bacterium]
MDLVKLTEFIIKELVNDKESVTVKEFPSENEDEVVIQVMVPEDQMGIVIGKEGKNIKALRTIVQASSYVNGNRRVMINVDSY